MPNFSIGTPKDENYFQIDTIFILSEITLLLINGYLIILPKGTYTYAISNGHREYRRDNGSLR